MAHRIVVAGAEGGEGWSRSETERAIVEEILRTTPVPL